MMKTQIPFLFLLLLLVGASCENESAYLVPVIPDQNISFKIDGQQQVLSGADEFSLLHTHLEVNNDDGRSYLSLQRMSSDRQTTLRIRAEDLPLRKLEKGMAYVGSHPTPATITVTSEGLSGSIYCPHVEAVSSMSYSALLRFSSFTEDGRMQGTFHTAATGNSVEFLDGTFDLIVEIRD